MQVFIQSNITDSSKPSSKYAALQEVVGKWYTRAPKAQSDKSCTSIPIQPQGQQWKKAIMMIQKMSQGYGVTVSNLVDKW